jgi:hypothetical protein
MIGALHEIDHVGSRMNGQRMLGKAGSWRDIACHFASQPKLVIRCCRKQRNHQILQSDDTDAHRHQFGIRQFRDWSALVLGGRRRGTIGLGASLVVPI